ncbi:hypothetical protein P154DRAFT_565945 [Amniculicola lignicola CBS 123094]|uniref:Glycosyltransferase family 32 protein n=1 Tax=Amniculicola lignicola CBS 123094 TaxID=1392246 RepID=A0A6A5W7A2_9PLEO|nr:hypothetical protein P154DRAFT_565945 [Amniculicola lignicola CBS 123094]
MFSRTFGLYIILSLLGPHQSNGCPKESTSTWTHLRKTCVKANRRPHPSTTANIPAIISACRGSPDLLEGVGFVEECLEYLRNKQSAYLYIPKPPPLQHQRKQVEKQISSIDDGECGGKVFPYHAYWSGPLTWRVRLFIDSYLFTQNLRCARLTVWIDITHDPEAVAQAQAQFKSKRWKAVFSKGYVTLRPWSLPQRVQVPNGLDHSDGYGFVDNINRRGRYVDSEVIADSVIRDPSGQDWLVLDTWVTRLDFSPVSASDIFRFVVLHIYGGLYLDVDILLLRDLRPLLMSGRSFALRWGALTGPGDFNTAVLRLSANSSLSTHLLRLGTRLGLNFHPRTIGHGLWKDDKVSQLLMLESAMFDPAWPEFAGMRVGGCTTPCLSTFSQAFQKDYGPSSEVDRSEGIRVQGSSLPPFFDADMRRTFMVNGGTSIHDLLGVDVYISYYDCISR